MEHSAEQTPLRRYSRKEFCEIVTRFLPTLFLLGNGYLFLGSRRATSANYPLESGIRNSQFVPAYLKLHQTGELRRRGEELWSIMARCWLCPRTCFKNRLEGVVGTCNATSELYVSSYHPHFGEEAPLVGKGGSGTIFFTHCCLRCVFCINWEISIGGEGFKRSIGALAEMMLHLQKIGCENINLVTPTHYSPHILLALDMAAKKGLRLPIVYNTCGYERLEILSLLDGVVDIYLPDFKYFDGKMASKYSSEAESYPDYAKKALLEMNRQVGSAKPDENGKIQRGLMIRHLVMPNNVGGTAEVIKWIASNLPRSTYLNLMSQYTPMHRAHQYPEIARRLTNREYNDAVKTAVNAGLTNLNIQGY